MYFLRNLRNRYKNNPVMNAISISVFVILFLAFCCWGIWFVYLLFSTLAAYTGLNEFVSFVIYVILFGSVKIKDTNYQLIKEPYNAIMTYLLVGLTIYHCLFVREFSNLEAALLIGPMIPGNLYKLFKLVKDKC
jgi:uncharacterized protein with PQ loop repeat